MPSVCRRIVVLLVVALLGVGAPLTSAAFAQSGAGDQQYSDPFENSDAGGSNSSSGSGSSGSGDAQPLTQAPQSSGTSSGSSGSGSAGTTPSATSTSTSPAATGTLPNTGLDARVLVLAGVVLVLVGAGLRLRNAPEHF